MHVDQSYQLIKFLKVNVNSLLNKVDYITLFARDCELDVIAVSESWLVQSGAFSFVALDMYSII